MAAPAPPPRRPLTSSDSTTAPPRRPLTSFDSSTAPPRRPLTPFDSSTAPPRRPLTSSDSSTAPPRRPLMSSDSSNAPPRRPRTKDVTSRYLSPSPSTPSARRFPSPSSSPRSVTTPAVRRSSSVDRPRPSSTTTTSTSSNTSTSTSTTTTTRSLSVSFQGESFFFQTSRAKPAAAAGGRRSVDGGGGRPWPAAVRSLDYRAEERQVSSNGEVSCSNSDTESVSSGSNSNNSGSQELGFVMPPRSRVSARGICVPARFLQENQHAGGSPRPVRQPSPSRRSSTPRRSSPSPMRSCQAAPPKAEAAVSNAPSILSFATEVRRAKKGEYRIEEAHLLRLMDNRAVQMRWVNARVNAALRVQIDKSEKKMYNAWRNIAELRESVALKRIKMQVVRRDIKLASVFKRQGLYLDEWAKMEREHSNSLFGATEALKASTLRLPLVGGAQADIQKLKEVTSCAMDVINAVESSTQSFVSKVKNTNSSVHELARVVSQEHLLLAQSRDLLSTVTALHVKQCSLQGQVLQLKTKLSERQTQN